MPNLIKYDQSSLEMELACMKEKYENLASKHMLAMETIDSLEKSVKMRDETIRNLLVSDEQTQYVKDPLRLSLDGNTVNCEEEKNKNPKAPHFSELETLQEEFGNSSQDDYLEPYSRPCVPMPIGHTPYSSLVACSLCMRTISNYCPQYFSGYKLHPVCDICMKRNSLKDEEPHPFSSFPSSNIPSSLVTHWIQPYQLSLSPRITSSVSFRSHYVKLPNPGEILYTAQDILLELKELMARSNWWS